MLKLEYTNIVCKSNNKNSISSSNGYQLQGRKGSDQTHSTLQLGGRNGSGTCAGGDWHSCRGSGFGHLKCLSLLQTLPTGLEWGLCNRCRAVPAECWPNPPQCWGFRPKSEGDPRLEPMTCRKIHNIVHRNVCKCDELWNRIVSHVQRSQLTGPLCIWVVPCEPVDLLLRHDHDNVHSAQNISLCKLSSVTETLINAWRSPKSIVCFWTQQSTTCM